jgi:glycosyltransferase involved in cell wall biosynthesis
MVHDLFPLTRPEICELNTTRGYRSWFQRALSSCDFAITNSHSTRSILLKHLASQPGLRSDPLPCSPFTLGATLDTIRPKKKDHGLLDQIWSTPGQAMLALGTIEPRKNHRSILDAYDVLRARGLDVSLIVIGKKGWMSDDVIARLTHHPDLGSRLIYLPNASDFVVANAFQRSDCLVCASLSEGFGLPLVEGLMHGCHVVASDIEAFREVGGANCQFFSLHDPEDLPNQVEAWFRTQYSSDQKPDQTAPRWPDWSQSTREFLDRVLQLAAPQDVNSGCGKPY